MNDTDFEQTVHVMLKEIADGTPISEPPTMTTLRSGIPGDHRIGFGRTRILTVVGIAACLLAGAVAIVVHRASSTTTVSPAETAPNATALNETSATLTDPSVPASPTSATESQTSNPSEAGITSTSITNNVVPTRTPTVDHPARVLVVGDNEAGLLSPSLQTMIETTGLATVSTDHRDSSGLVRPDFFDWPTHLRESIPVANPDIVVALFGVNDAQSFLSTDTQAGSAAGQPVDSPQWRAEYAKRVDDVMNYLSADGRTLIWVGVPDATPPDLIAPLAVQNDVVAAEAAKHPNVIFVDSWKHFIGIDGSFAPYVLDPRDGAYKAVRDQTDPSHLNKVGEEILATYVDNALRQELGHRGAANQLPATTTSLPSHEFTTDDIPPLAGPQTRETLFSVTSACPPTSTRQLAGNSLTWNAP